MRLTTVLLLVTLMQVSATGLAQKISLSETDVSLKTIFKKIRTQSGYDFVYAESLLKGTKPISISLKNASLEEALEAVFKTQPLTYSINKNTITVKEKEPSLLDRARDVIQSAAKNLWQDVVRGVVKDQDGKPLPNASIRVKGKSAVTNTNSEGEFEIKGIADDAVLLVSYVGFKTLEISLKDAVMPLEIKLNLQTGELEEIKIVYDDGYQKLNKERSTGSFVHIDNELFNRVVGTNVLDRIYNITPGLIFDPLAGQGTGKNKIVIRGFSTINAGTDALVVVDNFPYDGDVNSLNPNDVESITVLKDAAASSIWGVRAGNGVIVITTKRGKFNQPTNVTFNSNLTVGQKPDLFYIPSMPSKDIIDFEKQQFASGIYDFYDDASPSLKTPVLPQVIEILLAARKRNNLIPNYNALTDPAVMNMLEDLSSYDVRNDIDKYLLQKGVKQQFSLNLSGGGDRFNYYASVGYDKNSGNDIHDNNNRISLNFNNIWRPIKHIEIGANIVHTRSRSQNSGSSYKSLIPQVGVSMYTRLADEQGNPVSIPYRYRTAYVDTARYPGLLDWHYRPLEDYNYINKINRNYDTRISAVLKYQIQPWLKAEFQYQNQTTLSNTRNHNDQGSFFVRDQINKFMTKDGTGKITYPYPLGDVIDLSNITFKAWNVRGSLSFNKQFGDHHVSAFAGMELRETITEANTNTLYGYDSNTNISVPISYIQTFPTRPSGSQSLIGSLTNPSGNLARNGSYFGTAQYSYQEKYLATASARIDQSNFFGVKANLRRVPLWSIGLGWNMNKEEFYHVDWLSILKLRASYGFSGNTNSGASSYATARYQAVSNIGAPLMNNVLFAEILTPNNPQLRWERIKTINAGVDFMLKNNRIGGSLDFYKKTGFDLLGAVIVDPTTGVRTFTGNQSSMFSKGMDFCLNTINLVTNKWEWTSSLNVSLNKDKVTKYGEADVGAIGYVTGNTPMVGFPLYSLSAYRWGGLNPVNGDPQIYLADTISSFANYMNATRKDLIFHGQKNPKVFGSFLNTFKYKQVSVSANITYQFGHYFRRNSIDYATLLNKGWNGHLDYSKRWKKPGDESFTNIPSLPLNVPTGRDEAYLYSNILTEKGDHIRLQDIRLNYSVSRLTLKKMPFRQISIYTYATNLGILWRANKARLDPIAYSGDFPAPKTLSVGLTANF